MNPCLPRGSAAGLASIGQRLRNGLARRGQALAQRLRGLATSDDKTLTVAIVLPLTGPAATWMQRTRIDWLRRHGSNPALDGAPHVTLKLGCPVEDLEPLARYVEDLAAQTAPLDIALRNFGFFDEGIIFLDVLPDPALHQLRRRIVADLQQMHGIAPQAIEGDGFHFHATLSHGLPAALFEQERRRLIGERLAFDERATAIELWVDRGTHWITYVHAPLAAAPSRR